MILRFRKRYFSQGLWPYACECLLSVNLALVRHLRDVLGVVFRPQLGVCVLLVTPEGYCNKSNSKSIWRTVITLQISISRNHIRSFGLPNILPRYTFWRQAWEMIDIVMHTTLLCGKESYAWKQVILYNCSTSKFHKNAVIFCALRQDTDWTSACSHAKIM